MSRKKSYKHAILEYDQKREDVFIEKHLGSEKVLDLKKTENLLNALSEDSYQLQQERKRNDSLTTRISTLRKDLEISKSRETDHETIRQVCAILQQRIDICNNEPVFRAVQEHLKRVKEELQKEGLWRE